MTIRPTFGRSVMSAMAIMGCVLLLLLLLLLPLASPAQDVDVAAEAEVDAERMDEIIRSHADELNFMGSVLVAQGDDVVFDESYGYANLEWRVPSSADTKYRIGSITKQFTAAAILLLEAEGKLELDDSVKAHMPDAPAAWDEVTIFHLLTHTSGIPSFTSFPEYATLKLSPSPIAQTVAVFRDRPLLFEPGERMDYSNSGYLLLGHLIETISGEEYEDFLRARVFEPLGMRDTGLDTNADILPKRASGYSPRPDGLANAEFVHMSIPHGAGALYSTTGDLLRWTQGLFAGDVLPADAVARMITPYKSGYALGLEVAEAAGRKVVRHGGGIEGFNAFLAHYPDTDTTVAVLANVNGAAPQQIAAQLGAIAHGDDVLLPSERQEISVSREQLTKLVGAYELAPTANMIISEADGRLVSRLGQQPQVPLYAESETRFFARVVDAQIEFELGESGNATALVLHQNGNEIRAPRLEERVELDLPPDVLARYTGTYRLGPSFDLTITLEDGRLMSQATGQPKAALYPETESKFFLRVANAQIEFVTDDGGHVDALILHQGGRSTEAPRQ